MSKFVSVGGSLWVRCEHIEVVHIVKTESFKYDLVVILTTGKSFSTQFDSLAAAKSCATELTDQVADEIERQRKLSSVSVSSPSSSSSSTN